MIEIDSNDYSPEILNVAKSFLERTCKNVVKKCEDRKIVHKFANVAQNLFYKEYVTTTDLKFLIYKLNEFKIKQLSHENFETNEEKSYNEARIVAQGFLANIYKHTITAYNSYSNKAKFAAARLQARFRGNLQRLVSRMELMNSKLMKETEAMKQRVRAKSTYLQSPQKK